MFRKITMLGGSSMPNTSATDTSGLNAKRSLRNMSATAICEILKKRSLALQLATQSETAGCKESRARFAATLNQKDITLTTPSL